MAPAGISVTDLPFGIACRGSSHMLRNFTGPTSCCRTTGPGGGVSGGAPVAVGFGIGWALCTRTSFHQTDAMALLTFTPLLQRAAVYSISKVSHVPGGRLAFVAGLR